MMQIEIQEAANAVPGFIELRLDFLAKAPDFKRLAGGKALSPAATVRGHRRRVSPAGNERLALLRQAIVSGFGLGWTLETK